jgi:protein TonB
VVVPPVKVHHVDPVYPPIAKQAGVQGTVVIDCVIDPMGNVVQARVLKSVAFLTDAAVAAVSQWKYRPSQLNGTPVPVIMTVRVDFHLR